MRSTKSAASKCKVGNPTRCLWRKKCIEFRVKVKVKRLQRDDTGCGVCACGACVRVVQREDERGWKNWGRLQVLLPGSLPGRTRACLLPDPMMGRREHMS